MPPVTSRDFQRVAGQRLATHAETLLRLGGGPIAMTNTFTPVWERKRTDETRQVEEVLRQAGFQQADAYRYNSASIRVRVIDPRFEGRSHHRPGCDGRAFPRGPAGTHPGGHH